MKENPLRQPVDRCRRLMAAAAWILTAMALTASARGADRWGPPLSAWLPEGALVYHEDADPDQAAAGAATAIDRMANLPELAPFRAELARSRATVVAEIAAAANIPAAEVEAVFAARRAVALVDVAFGPGGPAPVLALQLRFPAPPDPKRLYDALRAWVNQPQYVEIARKRGIPLNKICWEETWPEAGANPVLMIAGTPPVRIVLEGQSLLVYYGPVEPLRRLLSLMNDPAAAAALQRSAGFQAAWQGSGAGQGSAFLYLNATRLTAAAAAAGQEKLVRFLEELGLDSVQALGCSGAATEDGWRHSIYLHVPGKRTGLLSALRPGLVGAERYAAAVPGDAKYSFSARLDWRTLWGEIPAFIVATRRLFNAPRALTVLERMTQAAQFGATPDELLAALGDDLTLIDGPDGPVLRFDAAKLQALGPLVGRIEQFAGYPFKPLPAGRFEVRYLNRAKDTLMPLAPSLSLLGARQDNPALGTLALAAYPQALASFLGRKQPEPLTRSPEFARAMAGVGTGQSAFCWFDNRTGYRRVYNALLPLASLVTGLWPGNPPDPATLPPGSVFDSHLSGCAVGLKPTPTGVVVTAHSPLGFGGVLVSVIDTLVINNPAFAVALLSLHPDDLSAVPWGGR